MSGTSLNKTSGTTVFNPSLSETVLYAFARCGLRRTQLTNEHMQNARFASNTVLSEWANEQPNLWTVDQQSVTCVVGQAQYSVPATTILILDGWLTINSGTEYQTDLYMYPISRTEWAELPNKEMVGRPTVYWFDRLISPNVTLWQPPQDATWVFNYFRVRQMQDAALANAATLEIPYYFLKAFSDALSAELAVMYAPERALPLKGLAQQSWDKASSRNAESVPIYLFPGLSSYYRM